MKCLFLTYENPFTADTGDRVYSVNFLQGLHQIFDGIDIVYFDNNGPINKACQVRYGIQYQEAIPIPKKPLWTFSLTSLPGNVFNRSSRSYLKACCRLLNRHQYDFVFINHFKMISLAAIIRKRLDPPRSKLYYISHNVEQLVTNSMFQYHRGGRLGKLIHWQDAIKTKWYEKKQLRHFDGISSICEHDARFFQEHYGVPPHRIFIVRPVLPGLPQAIGSKRKSISQVIIAGAFIWWPKIQNLLLLLKAKNFWALAKNNIQLRVVGNMEENLRRELQHLYPTVEFTGRVPMMLPYYERCKLAIIPEKIGGGFKLKVAEAARNGAMIIAIKGAVTECNLLPGKHFIEKDSFEAIIEEIISLQKEPAFIDRMIEDAHRIAEEEYSMEALIKAIRNQILEDKFSSGLSVGLVKYR